MYCIQYTTAGQPRALPAGEMPVPTPHSNPAQDSISQKLKHADCLKQPSRWHKQAMYTKPHQTYTMNEMGRAQKTSNIHTFQLQQITLPLFEVTLSALPARPA